MLRQFIIVFTFLTISLFNFVDASTARGSINLKTITSGEPTTRDEQEHECGVYTNEHNVTIIGCNYNGTYVECPFEMPEWCGNPND